MKTDLRKPCKACPFRRNSVAGWLGPWSPTELLLSLANTPFPCHKTISGDGDQLITDDDLQGCAGAAIFLNRKCELSRAPETQAHQGLCRGDPISEAAAPNIFNWSQEFLDHHLRRSDRATEQEGK